ncbi:MAG: helix-turn-helix transcriptional regulator [Pirellulales bacterium]
MLLYKPPVETLAALADCFERIAFGSMGSFLPSEELAEVLAARNRGDLFIGGTVDRASETVSLWRGNLDSLVVPFSAFPPSGDKISPDFEDFAVTDYGHTIRLGNYEAAGDAILYELDPAYRRRKTKERLQSERTLGASIRRLRKQRGLRREDFAPLAAKTLARIEQGKVNSVHGKTLSTIAKVLGVEPAEIKTY